MATIWNELLGASARYYNVGGVKTRCIECGSAGEPVILLTGMWGHAEFWMKSLLPLSRRFRVYAVDMLGHGLTDAPDVKYELPDFVNHIVGFLDAAGLAKAHFIGNSLGGWVSAFVALTRPERLNKLILVCNASLKPTDEPLQDFEGLSKIIRMETEAIKRPTVAGFEASYSFFTHKPAAIASELHELAEVACRIFQRPETQKAALRMGSETSIADLEKGTQGASRQKYALTAERLKQITAPTYFLWGAYNPTMPAAMAEKAHKLVPGSKFEVMDCGHYPHLERYEAFNDKVSAFLSS